MKDYIDKRKGDGLPRFDFTINIPTLIMLIALALAGFGKAKDFVVKFNSIIDEHNILWEDYLINHPGRRGR